jgi:hypothetical protein
LFLVLVRLAFCSSPHRSEFNKRKAIYTQEANV